MLENDKRPIGTVWDRRMNNLNDDDPRVYIRGDTIDDEDDNNLDKEQVPYISTCAGQRNPEIRVLQRDGSCTSVPVFVLLNCQGHVLVRDHGKLRMSKGYRSFFEKIVAKSSSEVVPLVYAEAQLFPSVFWQSFEDGSIAGALPTALWCDSKTLRNLGVKGL